VITTLTAVVVGWIILIGTLLAPLSIPTWRGSILIILTILCIPMLCIGVRLLLRRKRRILPTMSIMLSAGLLLCAFTRGIAWGAKGHLWLSHSRYDLLISQIRAATTRSQVRAICGENCSIVGNSSDCIAFHYCHLPLSWFDIVYDPVNDLASLDVEKLRSINRSFLSAESIATNWYVAHLGD
jgi:hypothetical protein